MTYLPESSVVPTFAAPTVVRPIGSLGSIVVASPDLPVESQPETVEAVKSVFETLKRSHQYESFIDTNRGDRTKLETLIYELDRTSGNEIAVPSRIPAWDRTLDNDIELLERWNAQAERDGTGCVVNVAPEWYAALLDREIGRTEAQEVIVIPDLPITFPQESIFRRVRAHLEDLFRALRCRPEGS